MVGKKARLRLKQAKPPNLVGGSKQYPTPFAYLFTALILSTSLFLPVLSRVCSNRYPSCMWCANVFGAHVLMHRGGLYSHSEFVMVCTMCAPDSMLIGIWLMPEADSGQDIILGTN